VTAVAAFLLSTLTYWQLNLKPDVYVIMPKIIRVSVLDAGYSQLLVQPTFTAERKTERPAVLRDVVLLVEPQIEGGEKPLFYWREVVEMSQDDDDEQMSIIRKRVSDPTPLLVFGGEPVSPMLFFESVRSRPTPSAGKMRARLLMYWQDQSPTVVNFCIDLSQESVDRLLLQGDGDPILRYMKYETSECYFRIP
jgi:hypothetical protein